MHSSKALLALAVLLFAAGSSAHAAAQPQSNTVRDCTSVSTLGRFEPGRDILFANFDNKPDTDDLLAVAGLATMLRDNRFACVRYVATTGAYGSTMESFVEEAALWRFIEADSLFDLAFPGNWIDAHRNRAEAITLLADHALTTLHAGGDVWIMEAGQSDLSAAIIQWVSQADPSVDLRSRIHLVQHSAVNEYLTTESALIYVRENVDYIKIPDGNIVANGSPGFETMDPKAWSALLADPRCGAIWEEARRLALRNNPTSGHPNEIIAKGGLDFSDLAEATYIFGFEELVDVDTFVTEFVSPPSAGR